MFYNMKPIMYTTVTAYTVEEHASVSALKQKSQNGFIFSKFYLVVQIKM